MRAQRRLSVLAVLLLLASCDRPSVREDCRVLDGTVGEAQWMMCLPPRAGFPPWNGDLVVYAHGYVDFRHPLDFHDFQTPEFSSLPETVLSLGYAFAATTYPENGLVRDGVEDVRALAEAFWDELGGLRGRSYLVGASEGGMVTTLAVERHPTTFSGGLALCGPIGDFRRQIEHLGNFRVLFDYFFPGVLPGSPIDIPEELIAGWDATYAPAVAAAVAGDPSAALQLMVAAKAPFDPADPDSVTRTILDVLWYNVFATNDAKAKLHGNPFDNLQTWYSGSLDDARLNRSVARFAASPVALEAMARFQTTGKLSVPLVTMHTEGDPIVPFWHERLYAEAVAAHSPGMVTQHPVAAYGHCRFTTEQILAAFAELVLRAPYPDTGGPPMLAGTPRGRHEWGRPALR